MASSALAFFSILPQNDIGVSASIRPTSLNTKKMAPNSIALLSQPYKHELSTTAAVKMTTAGKIWAKASEETLINPDGNAWGDFGDYTKKDVEFSASSRTTSLPIPAPNFKKMASKRILSTITRQHSKREPSTTGAVKTGMTITEKILANASEKTQIHPGENVWVNVDVLMTHDVCGPGAFGVFKREFGDNAKVWDREKVVVIPDHYIFTDDERANRNVDTLREFCTEQSIKYFYDIEDRSDFKANPDYKGVCHVALAQEGHCRPGEVLLGTDSHTCTAGAFGQFATGIGITDAGFVLGTGKLLLKVPPTLKFVMDGEMPNYLLAKDLILQIIGEISVSGATYKAMEFVGSTIESLTMEERMTLCNMVIEAGGKNGVVPANNTTYQYLEDGALFVPYEPVHRDGEAIRFLSEYLHYISKLKPLVNKPLQMPPNMKFVMDGKLPPTKMAERMTLGKNGVVSTDNTTWQYLQVTQASSHQLWHRAVEITEAAPAAAADGGGGRGHDGHRGPGSASFRNGGNSVEAMPCTPRCWICSGPHYASHCREPFCPRLVRSYS